MDVSHEDISLGRGLIFNPNGTWCGTEEIRNLDKAESLR
jgi:hypothetical protein